MWWWPLLPWAAEWGRAPWGVLKHLRGYPAEKQENNKHIDLNSLYFKKQEQTIHTSATVYLILIQQGLSRLCIQHSFLNCILHKICNCTRTRGYYYSNTYTKQVLHSSVRVVKTCSKRSHYLISLKAHADDLCHEDLVVLPRNQVTLCRH